MKLLFNYLKMHLKTALEYKSSFILMTFAQLLIMLVEAFTLISLFSKFSLLDEYNINELLLVFSTIWFGYSLAELLSRGFDEFYQLIIHGDFDILLIRPKSLFVQIMGSNIAYQKIGRVLIALAIFIYSSIKIINVFTLAKIILLILMAIGSYITITSLLIIGASLCFITIQGLEFVNVFTYGTKQVVQYPMSIYNKTIKFIFTFIIPMTFINYYPILYLKGNITGIYNIFMPLISVVLLFVSIMIFKLGVKKYCSTGS